MKKVLLILGNITFDHFTEEEWKFFSNRDGRKALIHDIEGVILCESKEKAEALGEELVNEYGAYVVPEFFDGEVAFQSESKTLYIKRLFL